MRFGGSFCAVVCFFQLWQFFDEAYGNYTQPHIIFIIADDLGWNDVGFRGSNQIPTPNIDALAYNGIVLDRHYTQPSCTPSRAALLTGKYPIRLGLQGYPIAAGHQDGIPLSETLLPEHLQALGYTTRLIGKWHVGYFNSSMTPTKRGFDSHFGYMNGFVSYKNVTHSFGGITGFDCYRNLEPCKEEVVGEYLTDVYTKEAVDVIKNHSKSSSFQPLFLVISHAAVHTGAFLGPQTASQTLEVRDKEENAKKYKYISNPFRQLYAGMLESLDSSVGEVIDALDLTNMLRNSIVVFITDNGGPTVDKIWGLDGTTASNWPLRGLKGSPFEGGVRGVAVAWSSLFQQLGRTSDSYMHISDWLPTLYTAAGGNAKHLQGLDGIDQWSHLVGSVETGPRNQFLINIDEQRGIWGVVKDEWKLLKVNATNWFSYNCNYYGENGRDEGEYNLDLVLNSPASKALRQSSLSESRENYLKRRKSLDVSQAPGCEDRIAAGHSTDAYSGMVPPERDRCTEVPCLFNIRTDPCEFHNVANENPSIVGELYELLIAYNSQLVKQQDHGFDSAAHPDRWQGYWAPWMDTTPQREKSDCEKYCSKDVDDCTML